MKPQKSFTPLIVGIALFLGCLMIIGLKIFENEQNYQKSQEERQAEEERVLQEISAKTGLDPSWLVIREYIYCDFLQKDMMRSEVEDGLSKIWSIETYNTSIYFVDSTVNTYLGPVMVVFSFPGPEGKLLRWSRSPDINLGVPLAECENEQEMYNAP